MPQTKSFGIKEKHVLFREMRYCIHSNKVKQKQGNHETKNPRSSRARNIHCNVSIHIRLERWCLKSSHPLEINVRFTHNYIINSAEALSFRHVKDEVREKYLELFKDGHSAASTLYTYEDELHLNAVDDQDLIELLADRASNPDYDYIAKLFHQYCVYLAVIMESQCLKEWQILLVIIILRVEEKQLYKNMTREL